jgi:putative SOS response-associated peptidase YedK
MCARFTQMMTWRAVWELYQIRLPLPEEELRVRYNVAPTQLVAVVRAHPDTGEREAARLRWGLIPFWAKDVKIGQKLINARGETVADKPAFRAAFKRRRCVIPASGFFEWEAVGKKKQPHYIHREEGLPLSFAGLWEHWAPEDHEPLDTFTIVTASANAFMAELHERMPVVLEPEGVAAWLDPATPAPKLKALLDSRPWHGVRRDAVNPIVNSVKNDVPACIEPLVSSSAADFSKPQSPQ